MTEDQKEKFAQEKQRLLQNNSLILATVNTEGHPLASSTPFVTKGGNFYIFISNKLSPHTQNLLGCSTANILLVESYCQIWCMAFRPLSLLIARLPACHS